MSILVNKNYLISTNFYSGSPDVSPGVYIGSFEELRRTIATTWSKIDHSVQVKANAVEVRKESDNSLLALFIFTNLTEQKLPEHF